MDIAVIPAQSPKQSTMMESGIAINATMIYVLNAPNDQINSYL